MAKNPPEQSAVEAVERGAGWSHWIADVRMRQRVTRTQATASAFANGASKAAFKMRAWVSQGSGLIPRIHRETATE
jgi:hypothetical protein